MNRRGNVAWILLAFITIAVCLASLFTMASYSNKITGQSKTFVNIDEESRFSQNYVQKQSEIITKETLACTFKKEICDIPDVKQRFKAVADAYNFNSVDTGNFFGQIRNDKFEFSQQGDNYGLTINDLFVQAKSGENKIVKNFNICKTFTPQGDFVGDC